MTVELAKNVEVGQVGREDNEPKTPTAMGMHAEPVQIESEQVDNEQPELLQQKIEPDERPQTAEPINQ